VAEVLRWRLRVEGQVQGVGFRPFIYRTACRLGLTGFVINQSGGVLIEAEGSLNQLQALLAEIQGQAPRLSRLEKIERQDLPALGQEGFRIASSLGDGQTRSSLPPDTAICQDCLQEMYDPADRRFGFVLINCTQCGPRYSIVHHLPYDRPGTTLADFPLCPDCLSEYSDPCSRRFHAQPIGCWNCGPQLQGCLEETAEALKSGQIVAVKGVGGYHLIGRADLWGTVARLRQLKGRYQKPLAVMAQNLEEIRAYAEVGTAEARLLTSPARPIVLLRSLRRLRGVAPGQSRLGFLLPYTGLHHRLLDLVKVPLVVTSANRSGQPVMSQDDEASQTWERVLAHQRPIHLSCDDSVAFCVGQQTVLLRRARGYCLEPIALGFSLKEPILACGGLLKSAFCLGVGDQAYLSPYLGDLDELATRLVYLETRDKLQTLLGVRPVLAARDLHPDCPAAELNRSQVREWVEVQHHHAHVAAVMAEYELEEPVLGLAFDGTGYGTDGSIWGGEVLLARRSHFQRLEWLRPVTMPGGEAAVRQPWRMAAAHLFELDPDLLAGMPFWHSKSLSERRVVEALLHSPQSPRTSSMGRLLDAAACLILGKETVSYEAEAAMELESALGRRLLPPYPIDSQGWDPRPMWAALLQDLQQGRTASHMAGRLHSWLVSSAVHACLRLGNGAVAASPDSSSLPVVLSGGVFQNQWLLTRLTRALEQAGFRVYFPSRVPPNDGGLALGQVAVAAARLDKLSNHQLV